MEIKLSPEQEAALIRSNEAANRDPETRPTLDQFVQSVFDTAAELHVKAWEIRDAAEVDLVLKKTITTMTPEDKATVVAILNKYELKPPVEVAPPVEEPPVEEPIVP
jgi:hypothetical protein